MENRYFPIRASENKVRDTPIFHLRLGNRLVYVVSSHCVAEECFTRNDVVLANRPELIMGKHVAYDSTIMIAASYGDHWRNLRRVAAVEIFSSHRVNTFMSIRKDEIRRLISHLSRNSLHVRHFYIFINLFLFFPV